MLVFFSPPKVFVSSSERLKWFKNCCFSSETNTRQPSFLLLSLFRKFCIFDEVAFLSLTELSLMHWSSDSLCPLRNLDFSPGLTFFAEKNYLIPDAFTFWILRLSDYFHVYMKICRCTFRLLHPTLSPASRSSRAWDATRTTATFTPKYRRNSAPTVTPAAQSSATPGLNAWKPTIDSVRKTWGKSRPRIFSLYCCAVLLAARVRVNTAAFTVHSSSGTDRVDFKFYDLLEQILDKQPSTSCTVVTDSIEISEDSNSESVTETGKYCLNSSGQESITQEYTVYWL